jgi:GDP-mannose 6-dehydrogenase
MFHTRFREAEMTKFTDNAFHALKVAFGNEIGRICQQFGADVDDVHRIFVSDTHLNISPKYLRPGGPFGGSCLPKDVRALQRMSLETGAETHVIDALLRSNEAHKQYILRRCSRGLAAGARVLLLGLAFKDQSDDLRESPQVELARDLIEAGYQLSVYDPHLRPEKLRGQNLGYAYSHLPSINALLVSRDEAENGGYDLVIDANDTAVDMSLYAKRVINIASMR